MPKLATVKIDDEIKAILAGGTFKTLVYVLPDQLDRKTYERANKVLSSLGAKWNRSKGGHVFPNDDSIAEFRSSLSIGHVVDRKKTFGQFDTPIEIAEQLVRLAEIKKGRTILEPSAGIGRIADAIWEHHGNSVTVDLIEIDRVRHSSLSDRFGENWLAILADFLEFNDFPEQFDRIIANPPFANGDDARHVMKMLDLLKPDGRLVTVMASAIQFRDNGPYRELKERLDSLPHYFRDLPRGTFKESGTGVNTCFLVVG